MSNVAVFIRQIRSRSNEHQQAMELLSGARLAGQMIAVLRQELDSLIRVFYLLTQDLERREVLVEASINGGRWTQVGKKSKVTDKEMVGLAQGLIGWAQSVYNFGCAFIHLSNLHDYNDRDPIVALPQTERDTIFDYCRHYHGGPASDSQRFEDLLPYLPQVLTKISKNLDCYLEKLEEGAVLPPSVI